MRSVVFTCISLILLSSCSELKKAENLITGLSEKEQYQKDFQISDELFEIWNERHELALDDSLEIELPYTEKGMFKPRNFAIYSYQVYLMPGEVLEAEIKTDSSQTLVFSSLFRKTKEDLPGFKLVKSGKPDEKLIKYEIKESGLYKLILQPEIEAHTAFNISVNKSPAFLFPVSEGRNGDIGSYWGDIRDGGRRNHQGIDIFAKRGTPVIAAVDGRVGFTGEKGLGGKQVWLRDPKRRLSLYYAHLDSIVPNLSKVSMGDTLGFVGNTGNAATTPPHLHFGVYGRGTGAIDPLGYVYLTEVIEDSEIDPVSYSSNLKVSSNSANFRNKPATSNSEIIKKGTSGELLAVQGKTADWFHVRDSLNKSMYIHESQVEQINFN